MANNPLSYLSEEEASFLIKEIKGLTLEEAVIFLLFCMGFNGKQISRKTNVSRDKTYSIINRMKVTYERSSKRPP